MPELWENPKPKLRLTKEYSNDNVHLVLASPNGYTLINLAYFNDDGEMVLVEISPGSQAELVCKDAGIKLNVNGHICVKTLEQDLNADFG